MKKKSFSLQFLKLFQSSTHKPKLMSEIQLHQAFTSLCLWKSSKPPTESQWPEDIVKTGKEKDTQLEVMLKDGYLISYFNALQSLPPVYNTPLLIVVCLFVFYALGGRMRVDNGLV